MQMQMNKLRAHQCDSTDATPHCQGEVVGRLWMTENEQVRLAFVEGYSHACRTQPAGEYLPAPLA